MKFAAKEINAKGGLGGYTIKIVSKDNKGDQTQTATTTQELLDQGIKIFVITTGDTAVAGGQLAVQGGAIASVGGNTAPEIVKSVGKRGFMIVFGDNVQASAGAQYACKPGLPQGLRDRLARDPVHEVHPALLRGRVQARLRRQGHEQGHLQDRLDRLQHAGHEDPERQAQARRHLHVDVRARLRRVHEAAALGRRQDAGRHGRRQRQLAARRLRRQRGRRRRLHDLGLPGRRTTSTPSSSRPTRSRRARASESNTLEAIGRDNIYVIAEAASRAKSSDPDKILAAVYKFKHYKLATGDLTMDPVGQVPIEGSLPRQDEGQEVHVPDAASRRSTSRKA